MYQSFYSFIHKEYVNSVDNQKLRGVAVVQTPGHGGIISMHADPHPYSFYTGGDAGGNCISLLGMVLMHDKDA